MKVMMVTMMTITLKIETIEVIGFLVTSISMTNEKLIAIPIPWKAPERRAFSTGIAVHPIFVCTAPFRS